ncbi:hypothetical protein K488DRAFT_83217 [Vararia minispora EC-137]|uniref:Uncharacterized protein n=1 Tax=Vararia minispora EC-137 TaxID=1314806 RepID=A0ACB8QTU9_9AGAM|nr:hypothetical protein K488DRAFT_83217 [Vararia minispora EC-137]
MHRKLLPHVVAALMWAGYSARPRRLALVGNSVHDPGPPSILLDAPDDAPPPQVSPVLLSVPRAFPEPIIVDPPYMKVKAKPNKPNVNLAEAIKVISLPPAPFDDSPYMESPTFLHVDTNRVSLPTLAAPIFVSILLSLLSIPDPVYGHNLLSLGDIPLSVGDIPLSVDTITPTSICSWVVKVISASTILSTVVLELASFVLAISPRLQDVCEGAITVYATLSYVFPFLSLGFSFLSSLFASLHQATSASTLLATQFDYDARVKKMEEDFAQGMSKMQQLILSYEAGQSNAALRVASLQSDLDATQLDLTATQLDLATTRSDLATTQSHLVTIELDLAATQSHLATTQSDFISQNDAFQHLCTDHDATLRLLNRCKQAVAILNDHKKAADDTISSLRDTLHKASAHIDALVDDKQRLKAHVQTQLFKTDDIVNTDSQLIRDKDAALAEQARRTQDAEAKIERLLEDRRRAEADHQVVFDRQAKINAELDVAIAQERTNSATLVQENGAIRSALDDERARAAEMEVVVREGIEACSIYEDRLANEVHLRKRAEARLVELSLFPTTAVNDTEVQTEVDNERYTQLATDGQLLSPPPSPGTLLLSPSDSGFALELTYQAMNSHGRLRDIELSVSDSATSIDCFDPVGVPPFPRPIRPRASSATAAGTTATAKLDTPSLPARGMPHVGDDADDLSHDAQLVNTSDVLGRKSKSVDGLTKMPAASRGVPPRMLTPTWQQNAGFMHAGTSRKAAKGRIKVWKENRSVRSGSRQDLC